MKKSDNILDLHNCKLCPKNCGVDRAVGVKGYCGCDSRLFVARAALHMWEEPCISGEEGSGTVFFSGCNMRCIFCQNNNISNGMTGKEISVERLAGIFLELQGKKANNINLVTPTQYIPHIIKAIYIAKNRGLKIPIVYNTSGYEKVEVLEKLDGLVDIYLPDMKYFSEEPALKYSNAANYFSYASAALQEMYRQVGTPEFDKNGIMKKGIIVRHLLLPGRTCETENIIRYLYENYGDNIYMSIMSQYTPMKDLIESGKYPELAEKIDFDEYNRIIDNAIELGVENAFIQEDDVAMESFIPDFNCEGV